MSLHILALETSASRCGVALLRHDGQDCRLIVQEHDGTAEHSARLLPMVNDVLAEAGLARDAIDAIAFGQGPGGFTGLRVACGVAQGIGFALDIPVLPVVSNAASEFQLPAHAPALRVVTLDARMQEVYLAVYRREAAGAHVLQEPVLIGSDDVAPWLDGRLSGWLGQESTLADLDADALVVAGDVFTGTDGTHPLSRFAWHESLRPNAAAVARLGLQAWHSGVRTAPDDARPLYVRDKVAFTTREREQGAGGNPRAGATP